MARDADFFQRENDDNLSIKSLPPFFTIKGKSEEEVLKWLQMEIANRERYHEPFFGTCFQHLRAYKNAYNQSPRRQTDSNSDAPFKRTSKYTVNHLYEMTENMVSKMTRVKPAVEVLPANDEYEDQNSAKAVKLLIQHLWYINDIDLLVQKLHRHKYIFGEGYILVDWNSSKGDLHPKYVQLRNANKLKKDGSLPDQFSEVPVKVGDVEFSSILPWNILLECTEDFCDVKNAMIKSVMHIAEIKKKYPKAMSSEIAKNNLKEFNVNSLSKETLVDRLPVYTFYHKADEDFPQGKKITFIHNMILETEDLGFSHGELPFLRLSDIDIPGQLHGMSRYQQVLSLQNAHNNLSQSIMKNEFLMSAPKWMMPKGACKVEQLANSRTIVTYQGPVAPQLVQMNPTSPTTFAFRDKTESELGQIFGVHPISRGEPPKGITAAVALQFLNEQETERGISDIAKHNQFIKELAIRSISVAGDNYKADDGRMLRVLGKENRHLIKTFDTANLSKDYDVRIQNSSALPTSKAAQMERIIYTMQYAPNLFTPERWAELLEFGSVEKMHTLATEAIHSAESTVQDILEGHPTLDPEEWEDLITHLRVYYKALQKRSFKEEVPEDRRELFKLHVETVERLASEKAAINPLFASKLAQLELFPIFWKFAEVPASAEHQMAMVQGQANRGEPVSGQIPATEPAQNPLEVTQKGSL